jgi:hypothetical protein
VLSISHSLTGALVATTLHPVLVVPAIFATHYIEDWIPHWDVGTGLSNGSRKRTTAIALELGELAITAILLYLFFQAGKTEINYAAWIGGGLALVPDFLEAPRNFLKWEPGFFKPINNLHQAFHHSTPNIIIGLAPQVVLWWVIWWLR